MTQPRAPSLPARGFRTGTRSDLTTVQAGSWLHPFGQPRKEEMASLVKAMEGAGRNMSEFEIVGDLRGSFRRGRCRRPVGAAEAIRA